MGQVLARFEARQGIASPGLPGHRVPQFPFQRRLTLGAQGIQPHRAPGGLGQGSHKGGVFPAQLLPDPLQKGIGIFLHFS